VDPNHPQAAYSQDQPIPNDVTEKEWGVIEPYLPAASSTGRPRAWPMLEIINGIFYVMRSGCPWRLLPSDLPPWSTI